MSNRFGAAIVWTAVIIGTIPAALAQVSATARLVTPNGGSEIPRMPDGKPDLSGVWERPPVLDMSKNGPGQQGPGELPMTAWAKAHYGEAFDSSGHCLPIGYTRDINSPFPIEIVQRPNRVVFLYEFNNIFHHIYTDGRPHPKDLEPTWNGHSIGHWEGDTLVVDTAGFNDKTMLDTEGHPHSPDLHVVERLTRTDAMHIAYEITVTDAQAYTRPWTNKRTFTLRPEWELMEYNCNENNRDLNEGHIK
jgi:hypothetical protein